MVDQERVCCLCGDVGFADKLFRCSHCRFRFQHSYCSNYYNCGSESSTAKEICDWCQSQGRNSSTTTVAATATTRNRHGGGSASSRSEYTTGERIKLPKYDHQDGGDNHDHDHHKISITSSKNNSGSSSTSGVPSPRPNGHRRYKLLKDVMC